MRDLRELDMKPLRKSGGFLRIPTAAEVHRFEQQFSISLPSEYVDFLSIYNGGRPTLDRFKTGTGYVWRIGAMNYLLPEDPNRLDLKLHPNGHEFCNLWAETRLLRTAILKLMQQHSDVQDRTADLVPFAMDTGNANIFAFDFRNTPPQVCAVIVSEWFRISKLADSFAEFIDQLYKDDHDDPPRRPREVRINL